jgi:hypothetical protein
LFVEEDEIISNDQILIEAEDYDFEEANED